MGDWYLVIKTIGGRRYRYRQKSWREGGKVRTACQCLGRAGADDVAGRRVGTGEDGKRARLLTYPEAIKHWESGTLVALQPDQLGPRERAGVARYTGIGAHDWNPRLRGDTPIPDPGVGLHMSDAFRALEHPDARLRFDCWLFRRCPLPVEISKPGDQFKDFAFMSFSVDPTAYKGVQSPSLSHRVVTLRLRGKAGDQGYIAAKGLTKFDNEREVLRYGGKFIILERILSDDEEILLIEEIGKYDVK